MPVQFRCSVCRKKLSVSRRKSGQSVACPSCSAPVHVPAATELGRELGALLSAAGSGGTVGGTATVQKKVKTSASAVKLNELPLFEREDFSELLEPVANADKEESDDEKADPSEIHTIASDTIEMTRSAITMLVIAVVALLGLAFAVGFLFGSK